MDLDAVAPGCPRCDHAVAVDAIFCGGCGEHLGETPLADRAPAGPGLWMSLSLYAASLAIVVAVLLLDGVLGDVLTTADWLMMGLAVVAIAISAPTTIPLFRPPRLTAAGLGLVALAIAAIVGFVELLFILVPSIFADITGPYYLAGENLGAVLVSLAVFPAISEEIIFRGPILGGLRNTFGDQTAIWVSAAMFATLHLSIVSSVHLLALGVLTATVRLRTRSLLPAIAIHLSYNAIVTVIDWERIAM